MPELDDELKKTLGGQLDHQLLLLDNAVNRMEEYKDVVALWPGRKRRLRQHVSAKMDQWNTALKKLLQPLNLKAYKRVNKSITRAGNLTFFHWRGFRARFKLSILKFLNILRILIVLGVGLGGFLLLIYYMIKGFGMII